IEMFYGYMVMKKWLGRYKKNGKARIKADRLLVEKLQEEERKQFTIEERAKPMSKMKVLMSKVKVLMIMEKKEVLLKLLNHLLLQYLEMMKQ
ncbi:hypothetical protein Tco_0419888, partial [Tanacetum coccineum]